MTSSLSRRLFEEEPVFNLHPTCTTTGCVKFYTNHKFGKMKASREGWYFGRNGDAWCKEHVPGWVSEWRERKKTTEELKVIEKDLRIVLTGLRNFPVMVKLIKAYSPDVPMEETDE